MQFVKWLKPDRAADIAPALENARQIADLSTGRRVRFFMAELADESGGFTRLVENLNYTNPQHLCDVFREVKDVAQAQALIKAGPQAIANLVYANRMGNGDNASGDGFRYRGRGWIQITGKDNYTAATRWSGLDLVNNPGLAGRPNEASQIAALYWKANNINDDADDGDFIGATRKINRALEGIEDRKRWLSKALQIWPD